MVGKYNPNQEEESLLKKVFSKLTKDHPGDVEIHHYLQNLMDDFEKMVFEAHLLDCAPCREKVDAIKAIL